MKILRNTLIFALLLCGFVGCQSEIYYQDQAVSEAREYLLKHSPELTLEEREYVSFNAPIFLYGEDAKGAESATINSRIGQICITWIIPGREDCYMVVGFSGRRMFDWSPNRLLKKDFKADKEVTLPIYQVARDYVYKNLYNNLEVSAATEVRFTTPKIYYSNLPLAEEVKDGFVQVSLVWNWPDSPNNYTIVSGVAKANLDNFTPVTGGFYEKGDFISFLQEEVNVTEVIND